MKSKTERILIGIICVIVSFFAIIATQAEYFDTPKGQFKEACWVACLTSTEAVKKSWLCETVFDTKNKAIDEDLSFFYIRDRLHKEKYKYRKKLQNHFGDLYFL